MSTSRAFFRARDNLQAELRAGRMKMKPTPLAVFKTLLENTMYTRDNRNGWVTCSGLDDLSILTGFSTKTIGRTLAELVKLNLISVRVRPKAAGGREANEIKIIWAGAFDPEQDTESSSADTESSSGGSEQDTESSSSSTKKLVKEVATTPAGETTVDKPSKTKVKGQPRIASGDQGTGRKPKKPRLEFVDGQWQ